MGKVCSRALSRQAPTRRGREWVVHHEPSNAVVIGLVRGEESVVTVVYELCIRFPELLSQLDPIEAEGSQAWQRCSDQHRAPRRSHTAVLGVRASAADQAKLTCGE